MSQSNFPNGGQPTPRKPNQAVNSANTNRPAMKSGQANQKPAALSATTRRTQTILVGLIALFGMGFVVASSIAVWALFFKKPTTESAASSVIIDPTGPNPIAPFVKPPEIVNGIRSDGKAIPTPPPTPKSKSQLAIDAAVGEVMRDFIFVIPTQKEYDRIIAKGEYYNRQYNPNPELKNLLLDRTTSVNFTTLEKRYEGQNDVIAALHTLCGNYMVLAEQSDPANLHFEKARQFVIKAFGPDSDQAWEAYIRLAENKLDCNQPSEAISLMEELVKIQQKSARPSNRLHSDALHLLGKSHLIGQQNGDAVRVLKECVELSKKDKSISVVDRAYYLRTLADAYAKIKNDSDARVVMKEAVDLLKTTMKEGNLILIGFQADYGRYATDPNELASLLELLQNHSEGFAFTLGPKHPDTWRFRTSHAILLAKNNRHYAAQNVIKQVIEYESNLPYFVRPQQPRAHDLFREFQKKAGDTIVVQNDYQAIIRERELDSGAENEDTLRVKTEFAKSLWGEKKYEEAAKVFLEVMAVHERVNGKEHPSTLADMQNAAIMSFQSNPKLANEYLEFVIDARTRNLGGEHPDTLDAIIALARQKSHEKNYAAAIEIIEKHREAFEGRFGPEDEQTLSTLYFLGDVLTRNKDYEKALEVYQKIVDVRTKNAGELDSKTLTARARVGDVYALKGNVEKAIESFAPIADAITRGEKLEGDADRVIKYIVVYFDTHKQTNRTGYWRSHILKGLKETEGPNSEAYRKELYPTLNILAADKIWLEMESILKDVVEADKILNLTDEKSIANQIYFGGVLIELKKFNDAENHLSEARSNLQDYMRANMDNPERTARLTQNAAVIAKRLSQVCRATDREKQALEYDNELKELEKKLAK